MVTKKGATNGSTHKTLVMLFVSSFFLRKGWRILVQFVSITNEDTDSRCFSQHHWDATNQEQGYWPYLWSIYSNQRMGGCDRDGITVERDSASMEWWVGYRGVPMDTNIWLFCLRASIFGCQIVWSQSPINDGKSAEMGVGDEMGLASSKWDLCSFASCLNTRGPLNSSSLPLKFTWRHALGLEGSCLFFFARRFHP